MRFGARAPPRRTMLSQTGIEEDGVIVSLFSDLGCAALITEFETDGCRVIPLDVSRMSFAKKSLGKPLTREIFR